MSLNACLAFALVCSMSYARFRLSLAFLLPGCLSAPPCQLLSLGILRQVPLCWAVCLGLVGLCLNEPATECNQICQRTVAKVRISAPSPAASECQCRMERGCATLIWPMHFLSTRVFASICRCGCRIASAGCSLRCLACMGRLAAFPMQVLMYVRHILLTMTWTRRMEWQHGNRPLVHQPFHVHIRYAGQVCCTRSCG